MILDKSFEDLLWIKLTDKNDPDNGAYFCSCYLPPSGSSRGDTSQQFYNKLTSDVYQYQNDLPLFIMGDLNGRIGESLDFNDSIDSIPNRIPLDKVRNQQGDSLIEFLKDSRMCTMNGRGDPKMDNYTSVSPRGHAVVDYIITPYECLQNVTGFKVLLVQNCLEQFCITPNTAKIPDHSILTCTVTLSMYHACSSRVEDGNSQTFSDSDLDFSNLSRKYKVDSVPQNIFTSEQCLNRLNDVIYKLETSENVQGEIDILYENLVSTLHTEMDTHLRYRDINKGAKRRKRHFGKPWWCEELNILWQKTRDSENAFLSCLDGIRIKTALRREYYQCRKNFDKKLRQLERQHFAKQRQHISELQTQNPKEFWSEINKLGPRKSKTNIDSVYTVNGNITYNSQEILRKWKSDFSTLFNNSSGNYDDDFLSEIQRITLEWEAEYDQFRQNTDSSVNDDSAFELNRPITTEEVRRCVTAAKMGRAVGIDNLPNEVLKSDTLIPVLKTLFNACLEHGVVPTMWYKTIISPILKKDKDYRDPMNYRGISLMSTISKLFSSILNERVVSFLDTNEILCEEQNGFRKLRACIDHIYVLTTVIRNRKLQGKETFLCYVDFSKAFDSVNRDCLWFKLMNIGIQGNILKVIKSMYENLEACVKVNGQLTDWFSVTSGVRQGDNLAPTLFAIFVNDIASDINRLNLGVPILNDERLSILKYADDIVLLAESAEDLQSMLNALSAWTKKWRLSVNVDKTKVMHCRKQSKTVTNFQFYFDGIEIGITKCYRYLGLDITDTLTFTVCSKNLHDAGSRSLGALIAKHYANKGLDFKTFEKIYYSTVVPITDYAAGVWGFKAYDEHDKLQNRAIRTYLGLGKSTCLLAMEAETGWLSPRYRRYCEILRLWHRLVNMDTYRLTHKVFQWDLNLTERYRNTWCGDVKSILRECDLFNFFNTDLCKRISARNLVDKVKQKLTNIRERQWADSVLQSAKLRTYRTFKFSIGKEEYLDRFLSIQQRSAVARFRCGSFPLAVELGRYRRPVIPLEQRTCRVCNNGQIENEEHFLIQCCKYNDIRHNLLGPINVNDATDEFKRILKQTDSKVLSNYIISAYELRNTTLANK